MAESSPFVVAQITDTHLFADEAQAMMGCVTARSLQAVLQELKQVNPKPNLLLLTGDLSQDETPDSYHHLQTQVAALNIPTYWIPGNHDRIDTMEKVLSIPPVFPQKFIQAGEWQLILLTSSIAGHVEGELSSEALADLEQQLQQTDRPTLVALHHPPLAIGSDWMDEIGLKNSDALFAILDRHPQVKLVLFGHIHQEFAQLRNGITYLGTPSTCIQFEPLQAKLTIGSENPGFRLINLYPDGSYSTAVQRVKVKSGAAQ